MCYGEELGLTSDDEDYVPPGAPDELKISAPNSAESLPEVRKQPFISSSIDKILTAKLKSNGALCVQESADAMPPEHVENVRAETGSMDGSNISRSASQDPPTDVSDNTDVSDAERNAR